MRRNPLEKSKTNFEEFIAGTDAADPDSRLSLSILRMGDTARFNWDARTGRSYSVFWATNLLDPVWQPIVTESTTGFNDMDVTDFPDQGYFKLSVQFQ